MIISLNWLKKFISIDKSIDELVELIGARLVEVEKVTNIADKYKGIIIVKVISAEKIEGSDHLSLVKIDDGRVLGEIERDEDGFVQVICGAPNIASGQMVVWLPPKTTVPSTFSSNQPLVLDVRDLKGYKSNGMIASAAELDISNDHTGILVINENDGVKPGSSFSEFYEYDDYLLDIENKSLTHRPDCFGLYGFAREVSAICGEKIGSSDDMLDTSTPIYSSKSHIKAIIEDSNLCSRYQAAILDSVDCSKQLPLLMQTYLSRSGMRPINAVVDVTNYMMIMAGQPLHAFDYDKVKNIVGETDFDIHIRVGKEGEKLALLDGRTIDLTPEDIIIAANDKPIALAGAMGGAETEIDVNTTKIILESANFNMFKLRSTQMRHGIFSEAITRFTKGQSPKQTLPCLKEAIRLLSVYSDASLVEVINDDTYQSNNEQKIELIISKVNGVLGTNLSVEEICEPLRNAEFTVEIIDDNLIIVTAPYWRQDINIAEDVIEEVGRIRGFDDIRPTLPIRDFSATNPDAFDIFRGKIRKFLVRAGSNEVLSYSFTHGDIMKKAGIDAANSYRITNSISPDLQYYRQTLTPNLLNFTFMNVKQGYDKFALFEINKVHKKSDGVTIDSVPVESYSLALVITDKNIHNDSPYYQAKKIFDYLCESIGAILEYRQIDSDQNSPTFAPFEKQRSAQVFSAGTNSTIGVVGEYKNSVIKGFKLPEYSAGFEIDIMALYNATAAQGLKYVPLSRFPGSQRDICFQVNNAVNYGQIISVAQNALDSASLDSTISPVDIFQADGSSTKNITIRVKLTSFDRTLTGDEVASVINSITNAVSSETNATVV